MISNNKQRIHELLKGIETGDSKSVTVVNEDKYIQHNPQTHEGSEGLASLFKRLSQTSPRVNIVRIFEDNDFIFAHTEYDFSTRNIGFEIFRFEDNHAVEHWDNIQKRLGPNHSNHSMIDGEKQAIDFDKTEANRKTIQTFTEDVLIKDNHEELCDYINQTEYTEHNPTFSDEFTKFDAITTAAKNDNKTTIKYEKCHRLLAEGNFVLSVCEGSVNEVHSSFFDLYRLNNNKISEHWDTTEAIPPLSEWKNNNGKF